MATSLVTRIDDLEWELRRLEDELHDLRREARATGVAEADAEPRLFEARAARRLRRPASSRRHPAAAPAPARPRRPTSAGAQQPQSLAVPLHVARRRGASVRASTSAPSSPASTSSVPVAWPSSAAPSWRSASGCSSCSPRSAAGSARRRVSSSERSSRRCSSGRGLSSVLATGTSPRRWPRSARASPARTRRWPLLRRCTTWCPTPWRFRSQR